MRCVFPFPSVKLENGGKMDLVNVQHFQFPFRADEGADSIDAGVCDSNLFDLRRLLIYF